MANSVVSLGQVQMIGDQVQDRWFNRSNFCKNCSVSKRDRKTDYTTVFLTQTNRVFSEDFLSDIPGYHVLNVLISVSGGHPAVVQLMLSPLSFSLNPSLKISLHQLRRESNCLWAISRILFLPATRYTFILPKNDLFHTFQPTSPIKSLPKGSP